MCAASVLRSFENKHRFRKSSTPESCKESYYVVKEISRGKQST